MWQCSVAHSIAYDKQVSLGGEVAPSFPSADGKKHSCTLVWSDLADDVTFWAQASKLRETWICQCTTDTQSPTMIGCGLKQALGNFITN